tara:strand:+ start:180406 stop:181428 length:1023 start_codon:yes stop_codon:yes gene_type:complete
MFARNLFIQGLNMKSFWLHILKPKGTPAKWLVFFTLFAVLAMGTLGYLDVVKQYLDTDQLSFAVGSYKMSAYQTLHSALIVVIVFWVAAIVSDVAEGRLSKVKKIRASNRSLLIKLAHIFIYFVATLIALDIVGIDLTTLTVFSGAVGIGLGFGLQKIASNFISGLILLLEKSVEQDDLVELMDGTVGFVRKSSARYTLLETFDGKEIMIPNEDFITNRVINWTFTNSKGRIEALIGVSYNSDIEKARDLILQAAKEHPRCIEEPMPKCFLRNFGDSSVDFVLHFWVMDVTQGRWEPHSEVLFEIWKKFKEHDIEIPFPQRDLHIRSAQGLPSLEDIKPA